MKLINLKYRQPTITIQQGDYVRLYEKIPDEFRSDAGMEGAIKVFCKLLIQQNIIESPSEDVEVIPYGRRYIIMNGSEELYHIE